MLWKKKIFGRYTLKKLLDFEDEQNLSPKKSIENIS